VYTKAAIMVMHLHKWGNSLGVRVPAHYIKQLNLTEADPLEMVLDLEAESLIIRRKKDDLQTLLSKVKPEHLTKEAWEEDSPRGHEVW
jgi:antitoxin MazE